MALFIRANPHKMEESLFFKPVRINSQEKMGIEKISSKLNFKFFQNND